MIYLFMRIGVCNLIGNTLVSQIIPCPHGESCSMYVVLLVSLVSENSEISYRQVMSQSEVCGHIHLDHG